jgi:hypothetical protein
MRQVFEHIAGCADHEFLLRISYVEIYSPYHHAPHKQAHRARSAWFAHALFACVCLCTVCASDERVKDLLNPAGGSDLVIHESKQRGVYVNGREEIVTTEDEVLRLMEAGETRRHYGQTEMNDLSSRSHTILRLSIESKPIATRTPTAVGATPRKIPTGKRIKPKVKVSTLNFVDLGATPHDTAELAACWFLPRMRVCSGNASHTGPCLLSCLPLFSRF